MNFLRNLFSRRSNDDKQLSIGTSIKLFLATYWRGIIIIITPLVLLPMVIGDVPSWKWCAFTILIMAIFWVTECIPLPVTSFLPVIIFPLTGIMTTEKTCSCYINDTVVMFLGSIMLAYATEQSGLHIRLALHAIRIVGYSRQRQLLALSVITMFISMWITNTAATSMMVPITYAIMKIYEKQNMGAMFEASEDGEHSTRLTTCFYCAITFSATIGGIGTLVGTATNLVHKGLFHKTYPDAPEYLTFINYCIFALPYMLVMEVAMYFWFLVMYLGMFRPNSEDAKKAVAPPEVIDATKIAIKQDLERIGSITYREIMVIILFLFAILLFVFRAPGVIPGWAIQIISMYGEKNEKTVLDAVPAMLVVFMMFMWPSALSICKHFSHKEGNEKPTTRIQSVLDWNSLYTVMPFSFMFLLGAGFALSEAAKKDNTNLNGVIGEALETFSQLSVPVTLLIVLVVTIFITNFASNVVVCNVLTPIGMKLAEIQGVNPLWFAVATGFASSYCFMVPVGTPGNLIVQGAAKIRTKDMIVAGSGLSLLVLFISWFFIYFYLPVVFPDVTEQPSWMDSSKPPPIPEDPKPPAGGGL